MFNQIRNLKLINKLYASLCPKCKKEVFKYAAGNKQKVTSKHYSAITSDMSDLPICDNCRYKLNVLMKKNFKT